MQDIDFLPISFREVRSHQQTKAWRVVVLGFFLVLVIAATWYQHSLHGAAKQELESLVPLHAQAELQTKRLAELQAEVQATGAEAALITYLRHPWPRSQLLQAVLTPLPDSIRLDRLNIFRDEAVVESAAVKARAARAKPGEAEVVKLPPVETDLASLREAIDPRPTVIELEGVASDVPALHRYLADVARHELLSSAEIGSIETDPDQPKSAKFTARVVVLPGYGQPGGPHAMIESGPAPSERPLAAIDGMVDHARSER